MIRVLLVTAVAVHVFAVAPAFGQELVLLSAPLAARAQAAITESIRLDKQDAPQRVIDERKKEVADALAVDLKARTANKAAFKP